MATKKFNAEAEAWALMLKRVAELERKVAALEARTPEQHTHYHSAPANPPQVIGPGVWPPLNPGDPPWTVTCATDSISPTDTVGFGG